MKWIVAKGLKSAMTFAEFKDELISDPVWIGDAMLATKALGKSWVQTAMYQGVLFSLFQGLLSGQIQTEYNEIME